MSQFSGLHAAFSIVIAAVFATQGAQAQMLPALPDAQRGDWGAVGVVNFEGAAGRAMCTGTLIAPDMVLTAAHCVGDGTGAPVFVTGGIGPQATGAYPAAEVRINPSHVTSKGVAQFLADQALIRLQAAVPTDRAMPLPLADGTVAPATLAMLGFHRMKPGALNADFACPVTSSPQELALRAGCQVIAGNSGGPALSRDGETWQVAGVITARIDSATSHQALIAPVGPWLREEVARMLARE